MPRALEGEKTPRVTLSLRVTPETKARIEADARASGRSLAVEAEARIEQSFSGSDTIASLRERLSAFGEDPHELGAVKAFALALGMMQRQRGASWREGDGIAYVVCSALRRAMARHTRNPMVEALQPASAGRDLDMEAEALAGLMVETMAIQLPPLPELPAVPPVDDRNNWTGEVRQVVTFKVKGTGEVLETVAVREGTWDNFGEMPMSPQYLEAIEKYRPRHHEIEAEMGIVQIFKSEASVWDVPLAYLTGPEEAARLMKGQPNAIRNRPAELFDRADFDEALNGKPRDDDQGSKKGTPEDEGSSGGAASPAPARRRKVKA